MLKVIASGFEQGTPYKWIDFPQPNYASSSADMVMQDGKQVGMSMFNGYSWNERCMLSLGVVDADVQEGDVLTLVWGEPDDHRQDLDRERTGRPKSGSGSRRRPTPARRARTTPTAGAPRGR